MRSGALSCRLRASWRVSGANLCLQCVRVLCAAAARSNQGNCDTVRFARPPSHFILSERAHGTRIFFSALPARFSLPRCYEDGSRPQT